MSTRSAWEISREMFLSEQEIELLLRRVRRQLADLSAAEQRSARLDRLIVEMLLFTGLLETIGSTLLTLGLFTRIVAFLLSGELAVGYWWMHVPNSFFPIANGGEVMVLYSFAFLYFAAAGPGKWSLDHRFRGR